MGETQRSIKVEDRVVCMYSYDGNDSIVDEIGIVRGIDHDNDKAAVEFENHVYGHDLSGMCEYGYGWWIPLDYLSQIEGEPIAMNMSFADTMGF